MPGITGCVRIFGSDALDPGMAEALIAPLSREPNYNTHPIVASAEAHAAVFSPRASFPVAGSAYDPQSGISAGYYGEFFGPEFASAGPQAIAGKLIELYRRHAAELPSALDGTFVVFLWDSREQEGILFNDHYASRPVCYAEQDGFFYFSPEPKGIARLAQFQPHTNDAALLMLLNYGHLLGSATCYREIQYLPPGSILRVSRKGVRIARYFEYLVNEKSEGAGSPDLVDQLAGVMRQAVQRRLHHLQDIVIPISGGYDSRGILAIAHESTGARLKTVSWGIDENTPEADAYIGRQVAKHYGTEHRFIPRRFIDSLEDVEEMVDRVDGGSMDAVMHVNELRLMRTIRDELGTDYLLRGDEIFGFKGEARSDAEALARVGLQYLGDYPDIVRLLHPARKAEFLKMSRAVLEEVQSECPLREPNPRKDYLHYYQKIRNFANRSNYYKLGVLESANPWLDKSVVEFLRGLPAPCRIEKGLYRTTLATHFPELMKVPISSRNSLEDFAALMRTDARLQKFVRFHLLEQRNRFHEMVDREQLGNLVKAVSQGQRAQSAKVRLYLQAKRVLKKISPGLYETARSKAQGHAAIATISPDWLIIRLLLMKLACDRLP